MFEVLIFFLFAVVIGLMFTFFGYPFFRLLLPIWAFFAGLFFGVQGLMDLLGPGFISFSLSLIVGFALALFLALVAYAAYSLAVYLFGITVGYVLGSGLMMALGFEPGLITFFVGAAFAIGLIALFVKGNMPRFLIIVLTASAGSMAVMSGIFVLFGQVPTLGPTLQLTRYMVWGSWFWLLVWAVLAGFGMAFQYAVSRMGEDDLAGTYDFEKEYTSLKAPK